MIKRFGLALVLLLICSAGAAAQDEEVLMVIGWEQEPDVPSLISGSAFSAYLDSFNHRDVWDWKGEEREIYPVMVEEVPTLENGLVTTVSVTGDFDGDGTEEEAEAPVVTYKLREGMLWSDGTPITADDCMFYHNLMMQQDPVDSVVRGFYPEVVEKAEKVDDYTVVLTYKVPWPDYLTTDALSCAEPAHLLLDTVDPDGDGVFTGNIDDAPYFQDFTQAVGYGPYVLSEHNVGQNMVFTRNPNWGINEWEVVPEIDTIITQFILESQQMVNALSVGDIDMAYNFTTTTDYDNLENVGVWGTVGVFNDALWLNAGESAHPSVQDVRVRRAIAHAIDRRSLADQYISEGAGEDLPKTWFPRQFTSEEIEFLEYDVELARELLTQAGWVDDDGDEGGEEPPTPRVSQGVEGLEDGTALVLRFFTTPRAPRPDYQLVIQGQLAEVGIATQLFTVEGPTVLFATFSNRGILNTGAYDLAIFGRSHNPLAPGTGAPTDWHCSGIPSAENPSGQNSSFFCDEEFDRLDSLVSITIDPEERQEYHNQAERIMQDAAIWHGLYYRLQFYAVRSDRWDVESMREMGTLTSNYFNQVEYWKPLAQ
jgi:peptide/nickel transport system substrate-binding protein